MKKIGISCSFLMRNGKEIYRSDSGYIDSVLKQGALPLVIPMYEDEGKIREIVDSLDGLILSGGCDVSPFKYGEDPKTYTVSHELRDRSEELLFKYAFEKRIPILAICRGLQLVNVIKGGTLIQDLSDAGYKEVRHSREFDEYFQKDEMYHFVKTLDGSLANELLGTDLVINSIHHQAIKDLGSGLVATGHARDGIIEAIEFKEDYPFFLGLQFHPERLSEKEPFKNIFERFIGAC